MPYPLLEGNTTFNKKQDELIITQMNSVPSYSASISSLPSPSTSSSSSIISNPQSSTKSQKTSIGKLQQNSSNLLSAENIYVSNSNKILTTSKRLNNDVLSKDSVSQLTEQSSEDIDDEIKVYKEEGTAEEEKRTSDNLFEEKTEIVKDSLQVIHFILN
jgi:hypothetical protein